MSSDLSAQHPPDHVTTTDRRALLAGIGGLAAGALFAGTRGAHAGPLAPPAGPIAPTPGPEPRTAINAVNTPGTATALFRITEPGSYYLPSHVLGEPGKNGIEITANDVTIDLMGFTLQGVPGSLAGILGEGPLTNITIVNGAVRNWGGRAMSFDILNSRAVRVDRVSVVGNLSGIVAARGTTVTNSYFSQNGLNILGSSQSTAINCTIDGGTSSGISFDGNGLVAHCTITGCQGIALTSNLNSLVTHCVVSRNGGTGISVNSFSLVSDCTSSGNVGVGISVSGSCLVRNNNFGNNGTPASPAAGIGVASSRSRIEDNHCNGNQIGIRATSSGNFFVRNTCSDNVLRNWELPAGNVCLAVVAAFSGPISGSSGGTATTSTDPNTNFSY